jgi:hypothetical protein
MGSQDGIVSIVTRCELDNHGVGVQIPVVTRIVSTSFKPACGEPMAYASIMSTIDELM